MYLTFDVGTTSVKTALYNKSGKLIHKIIREYSFNTPKPGWCEVHPDVYWKAVLTGFGELCKNSGVNPRDIEAVCGCSQGETLILLDDAGRPVRPAIVWLDNRAIPEALELLDRFGADMIYDVCGIPEMGHLWSAPKLLWLKKNEPESLRKTKTVLLVEDYIAYMLTGRAAAVPSLWATSILMDIRKCVYWDGMVSFLGLNGRLPELVPEASSLGRVREELRAALCLSESCIVIKGSMDQNMSALGAGNIKPGVITETTGTALVIAACAGEHSSPSRELRLPVQPHAIPGLFLVMPFSQTAGILYKWFKDTFGGEGDFEHLNRLASETPAGSDGLVLLPFFSGGVLPKSAPEAKGVFYGLTLKHGKGHFARAIMESIGFMLKDILQALRQFGIPVSEIHSMGGGARSDLWLSVKSDICGLPVIRMREEETSTLGAAIVCAVKTAAYASFGEAVQTMVGLGERFDPDKENALIYERAHGLYNTVFEKLYR